MPFIWYINRKYHLAALLMLQTSTSVDSEYNLFPKVELSLTSSNELSADEHAYYHSIKEELNKLNQDPPQHTIDNILNYSKAKSQ